MNFNQDEKLQRAKAKKKVQQLKIFYLHLALYIIVVALIGLNFYVMEDGPYTGNITALNVSTLVLWTIFICIHAWRVFKGKILFGKKWEDRKTKELLEKNEEAETTFWE